MGTLLSSPRKPQSLLLFLLFVFPQIINASVLAIDYGADFTKVSLMKPGVPFDVVLNRDSKRKIASSVAWKGEERLFGSDAVNIAARFPSTSYSSLKFLQGTEYGTTPSQFHALIQPALDVSEVPDRKTHRFKRKDGESWTNEELVAMQFSYVKDLAEDVAGERVRDAVVTVPAYYSQFERQAVLDSLELAGLKGLALINDGTAIAINYALSRNFPTLENHIIYDAGASGVRATLVSFHTVTTVPESKSKSKSAKGSDVTHVTVLGYGYDRVASGSEMDLRLREVLQQKFETAHMRGGSLTGEHRAIAKLWKEAARAKTILSANTESRVSIESFHDDIDFRATVTRAEFEEACADLTPRFTRPIQDALTDAKLELSDITSIVLAGGASRVPLVQTAIKVTFGEDKIAHNVNADEAAVLGAAFYGASLSSRFKTKEIKIQDRHVLPEIQLSFTGETKRGKRLLNTALFPPGSKYGTKKTASYRKKDDFELSFRYQQKMGSELIPEIFDAEFYGVKAAMKNLTSRGAVEPLMKVEVGLNESGMLVIHDAWAYGEVKDESITGKIKNFFAGSSSSSASASEETEESATEVTESETPTETEEAPEPTPTTTPATVPVSHRISHKGVLPYTKKQISAARTRLIAVENAEKLRHKKEEARNMLEGYLYRMRDLLAGEPTSPFMLYSKEEERQKLEQRMSEAFALIHEGDEGELAELWRRREEMETIEKPIQFRYEENEAAPKELTNLQQAIHAGKSFLESALQNRTMEESEGLPHKYTLEELEHIKESILETEKWLQDGIEEQKKLLKNDDPVLISAEMKARGVTLQNYVMKLLKRKTPKPPAPKKEKEVPVPPTDAEEEVVADTKDESQHPIHQEL
ncbi:hypothetical protein M408DRAFT_330520 [Serendipita vermifera MAFF 305830]|uniref:Uncharacterized protein n=1 Tax=Serendipita vermifera MAFF 305830 TaxID=933852 RepID=A0A0C2WJR6_SERVB|nr:hypothetical protein M408DRAFT_330520 [Serendipita vermifera MAFF 305830]